MNKILISIILITSTGSGYCFEISDLPVSTKIKSKTWATKRKTMDRHEMFQQKKIKKGRLGMQEKPGRLGFNTESSGANHGAYEKNTPRPVGHPSQEGNLEEEIPEAEDNRTRTNLQPRFVPIEKCKYHYTKERVLWAIGEVESGNKDIGLHPDNISYGRYGVTSIAAEELHRLGLIKLRSSYKNPVGNHFAAHEYLMLMARRHNVQNWLLAAGYYHSSTPDLREAYMLRIRKALGNNG